MNKKITMLLFMLLLAGQGRLCAQVPIIQWQRTYGGNGDDRLVSMRRTADGGFILGGHSASGISGEKTEAGRGMYDYWIIKTDQVGIIQWQKTYGGVHNDVLATIIQTDDLGYFVAGYSESGATGDKTSGNRGTIGSASLGRDFWLLRLDVSGNIIWQKTYGTSEGDMPFAVSQLKDGGFLVGGLSAGTGQDRNTVMAPSYGYNDHWILRLDGSGNILWQKSNGGTYHDAILGITPVPGGYVAGGYSLSGPSGTKTTAFLGAGLPNNSSATRDNWVVGLDTSGNIRWQTEVAGSGADWQVGNTLKSGDNGISLTKNGEILVGVVSSSGVSGNKTVPTKGGFDYWIVGLDSATGSFNWQLGLGGSGDEDLNTVFQTTDSGYFIAGYSPSGISGDKTETSRGGNDFWVLKTNAARNIQWQKTIGGSDDDQLMTGLQTADDWFLLGGYSKSGISGDKDEANRGDFDYWLVKLGPCDTTPTRVSVDICYGSDYKLPKGGIASGPGVYFDTLKNTFGTCDSVIITTVSLYKDSVHRLNRTVLGNDTAFCDGNSLMLDASYAGASWKWSNGTTAASIRVTQSGTYSVLVTSPNGCEAADTIDVTVFPLPVVDLGADTGICDVYLPFLLSSTQPPGTIYRWNTGLSSPQIEVLYSGKFWLEVEQNGCIGSDTIGVEVIPTPRVLIGTDSIICQQFPLTIGTEIPGALYEWNTGERSPYISVSSTGVYMLGVNLRGCHIWDTVNITAMPVPDINLGEDRDICPEQTILLDATFGSNSHYQWNTGDTTAVYAATVAGMYAVTVISEHKCIGSDSVWLHFYPKPTVFVGEDTSVCEETPLVVRPWYINADSLLWSDGSTGSILSVTQGGRYMVTGINKCGRTSDTLDVKQIFCDIWVPNAFTPNGDGINDVFRVLGNNRRMQGVSFRIYNRWGEDVFITEDKYIGWDGYIKGTPAPMGTYAYMLEYSLDGQPYRQTGNFHLLR